MLCAIGSAQINNFTKQGAYEKIISLLTTEQKSILAKIRKRRTYDQTYTDDNTILSRNDYRIR